jgi:hypothetical protein
MSHLANQKSFGVSSIVEVFITRGSDLNTVHLNAICGGAFDNNLEIIPDGTVVTLRRGRIAKKVKIRQEFGSECTANSLGVSSALARIFRLRNQTRYVLTYDSAAKTLTMHRMPVTIDTLVLSANSKMPSNKVGIGLGRAEKDGITLKSGESITLRNGNQHLKLSVVILTKNDVFNETFSLNPRAIRMLGLTANKKYQIAYDQIKRELVFVRQVAN